MSRAARRPRPGPRRAARLVLPPDLDAVVVDVAGRRVQLTNLRKLFWPDRGFVKRDLLQYYADAAPWLLPHVADRAMVMRRYPDGAAAPGFFMKRAPTPRPPWIETCAIRHTSGNVIEYPMVQDLPSLLWLVNLGCIDLNPWYARCDDVDRPDYLHFDLDPGTATFAQVCEGALRLRDALRSLGMPCYVKTTGSRGLHVYVPIVRGPTQEQVWGVAKALAVALASHHPRLLTAEYRVSRRPPGRVVIDYNQNARGRTLASIYSVRPHPAACVSMPVTWAELERGLAMTDFRLDNALARLRRHGDLWAPLLEPTGRFDLLGVA